MPDPNISYAQNGEDIVLWRALGHIRNGTYIDVGANHPTHLSVTRKFYDAGWRGLAVEPNPEYASVFAAERPRDTVIEAVISDTAAEKVPFHLIEGTGLSTLVDGISDGHRNAGWAVRDIEVAALTLNEAIESAGLGDGDLHFLVVDTEGAEAQVLSSLDFTRYRPWVLLIEATAPLSTRQVHEEWEQTVLDANYSFCLFDGLSRIYVAKEHEAELAGSLRYAASPLDDYVTAETLRLSDERDRARTELTEAKDQLRARETECADARTAVEQMQAEVEALRRHTAHMQKTLSWRITRPLRSIRRRFR